MMARVVEEDALATEVLARDARRAGHRDGEDHTAPVRQESGTGSTERIDGRLFSHHLIRR